MATDYDAIHVASLPSTQDEARTRFDGRPILVTADEQTSGRGRRGARWLNAPIALAASLAWEPGIDSWRLPTLTLTAGVAAVEALPGDMRLKWPNDVVGPSGAKVGGLIAETDGRVVVAGFGANLWWPDRPPGFGAVFTQRPGDEVKANLASAWVVGLLSRATTPWPRDEYTALCDTIGREIEWDGGSGKAIGLDQLGGLIVETDTGRQTITSGAVAEVRQATIPPSEEHDDSPEG